MSKSAEAIFDGSLQAETPNLAVFYEEIRRTVEPLLENHTSEEVESMSLEDWTALRQKFLGIKITLLPTGDIIHD